MRAKSYYAILGILPTATADEVKTAYRRREKKYHPDRFGEDSSPFLEVQEAYGVSSDPNDRRCYDRSIAKSWTSSQEQVEAPRRSRLEP